MEVNNIMIETGSRNLKCSLYNHLWLFTLITILNIIQYIKTYFIYKVYTAFYLISTILFFLLIPFPIYPLYLFKKNSFFYKITLLKKISLIVALLTIFSGVLINVISILNLNDLFAFYKECPYNFSFDNIADLFNINYQDNSYDYEYSNSEKCSDNRCLLMEENNGNFLNYIYLCNFDSASDFRSFGEKLVKIFFFVKINHLKI